MNDLIKLVALVLFFLMSSIYIWMNRDSYEGTGFTYMKFVISGIVGALLGLFFIFYLLA